jgi:hypothetical protein
MQYTVEYLINNVSVLTVEQQDNILAQLSQEDQNKFWEELNAPLPEEMLDPKFDRKLAKSYYSRINNLNRTKEQYQIIVKKTAEAMRGEKATIRSKKTAETLGLQGCRDRGIKAAQTLGSERRSQIQKAVCEKLGKEGLSKRSHKIHENMSKETKRLLAERISNTKTQQALAKLNDEEKVFYMSTECPFCKTDVSYRVPAKRLYHIRQCKRKSEKNNKL